MNPMPKGIDPLGTDADYHYRTERNYFLMVERARAAVRNHPLVEQGVNRLIANMRIGDYTLDVNSGDPAVDADQKAYWHDWCGDPKLCDYEQQRTFAQKARQSFFSQAPTAQKKLPERLCPRGAEDNNLFRERLDDSANSLSSVASVCLFDAGRTVLYPKRIVGILADRVRFVVRRNVAQGIVPGADPSTWFVLSFPPRMSLDFQYQTPVVSKREAGE